MNKPGHNRSNATDIAQTMAAPADDDFLTYAQPEVRKAIADFLGTGELESNYYTRNLDQLSGEDIKVKFVSSKGETHWMSISQETLAQFYPIFAGLDD